MNAVTRTMLFILLIGLVALACVPAVEPTQSRTAAPAPGKEAPAVQKAAWEQKWEDTLSKTKREGELTVYTTLSGDVVRGVLAAFAQKYGIESSLISARGPELIQRMETQRRAGLNIADVVIAGGTNLVMQMKPQGLLDKVDELLILPEVLDGKMWRDGSLNYLDSEHYGIGMLAQIVRPVLINTSLVKEGDIKSYKDVLKPQWKGKLVLSDPTIAGVGNTFVGILAQSYGKEETREFLRQLIKQDLIVTRDNRQLVEWVSRGKYEIGLGGQSEQVSEFMRNGAPISYVRAIEGSMLDSVTGGVGVANRRPNPNAATVFVNWLLSKEGGAVFVKNVGLPGARLDSPTEGVPSIFFPDPGEKYFINSEEVRRLQNEMLTVAGEVLAPILK